MFTESPTDDFLICCPFHEDTNPSCSVNLRKGLWYCFGPCARGGQLEELIAKLEGISYLQAAVLLAQLEGKHQAYFGSEGPRSSPEQLLEIRTQRTVEAHSFYESLPFVDWESEYHPYLMRERGFSAHTLNQFKVKINHGGMYPLVFPLFSYGMFVGYTTRCLGDMKPKYKHNPGFPRTCFLLSRQKLKRGPVLLVEGWLDKMMPYQHGWTNTAALMNCRISRKQVQLLETIATEIISATDADDAGQQGHEEICKVFRSSGLPVSRFAFPQGVKDPGSMVSRKSFWKGMEQRQPEKRVFALA